MLQQLERCGVAKPLLTTYPAAYEPPNKLLSSDPVFLVAERFSIDGRLVQHGVIYHLPKSAPPRMTALMSANFVFADSNWIKDVPYDPHMYFTGEEPTLAVRLWTHGWDMFGPSETLVWHRYGRFDRKLHWDDHHLWYQRDRLALERYNHLLGLPVTQSDPKIVFEIERYGLGTARTLEQYQQFAGINFQTREIKPCALRGDWKLG
jgi:hypothetical protein